MRKNIITISDNGSVYIPSNVQMWDFEIAELFGVMMPTVKSNIPKNGSCHGGFNQWRNVGW